MIPIDKKPLKRPSLHKQHKQKSMSMTMSAGMFSAQDIKQQKQLPPLRPSLRKITHKLAKPSPLTTERKETETTFGESTMFQSYYQTVNKGWVKPSDCIKEISELNLISEGEDSVGNYQIKLSDNVEKNMAKIQALVKLMEKWVSILDKVVFYTTSKKTTSDKLIEEVKFWKVLSKKFDQLQYEFNDQKTLQLVTLMKNCLTAKPEFNSVFTEFVKLKDKVVALSPQVKKLYWSLESSLAGNIQRFEESSDIIGSVELLTKILLGFKMIADGNTLIRGRTDIIYDKINSCLVNKLLAAPLYPRELANISGLKLKYSLIDKALSFYCNFLTIMQQQQTEQLSLIIESAEHTRNVLVHLLQILGYFEYLYKKKEVLEFSKLFSHQLEFNIYELNNSDEWSEYMERIEESMGSKQYEP